MADFLTEVQATRALLRDMRGKPGEQLVQSSQAARLKSLADSTPVGASACATIMSEIGLCGFTQEDQEGIMAIVARRLGDTPKSGSRAKLQDYTALPMYFSPEQWATMRRQAPAAGDSLGSILDHASKLGLRYPTEATWQTVTGMYMLLENDPATAGAMAPATKHELYKYVKKSGKRHLQRGGVVVERLPDSPADFRKLHPNVYGAVFGEAGPSKHPFGLHLAVIVESIPMRVSNASVTPMDAGCPAVGGRQGGGAAGAQALAQLASALMAQMLQRPQGNLPNLQFLGSGASCSGSSRNPVLPLEPPSMPHTPLKPTSGSMAALMDDNENAADERRTVDEVSSNIRQVLTSRKRSAPAVEGENDEGEGDEAGGDELARPARRDAGERKAGGRSEAVLKRPAGNLGRITVEATRSQVRCRSGDGTSFAIPWGQRGGRDVGTRAQAMAKAQQWLRDQQ